jgi:predicted dehydrogenase
LGNVNGFHSDPNQFSFPTRYREAYANIMEHFIDLCLGVTDKIAYTSEDLHNLTKVLDACCESAKTGLVVTVDYS